MKALKDSYPDPEKVVDLEPETLAHHILHILHLAPETNNKRQDVVDHLASHYHPDFQEKVKHAVDKALGFLAEQMLVGATPYDHDLLYVTQQGKDLADGYVPEHPSSVG